MVEQGLGLWMERRRLRSATDVAIIHDGQSLTYRQFSDLSSSVAGVLRDLGVKQGTSVAFVGENSPEFMAVLFGCALSGAVFVPVNTRLAAPEIAHVLSDSNARVLIHDGRLGERLPAVLSQCPLDHVLATGDQPGQLGALMASVTEHPARAVTTLDDPAAIIYTSGTTGRAKGAVLTHGNLTWVSMNCIIDYDVSATDVALMVSPLFHVASLGMGALPIVLKGGTLVLERGFDAGRALELIERHGVTMLSGVPTTFQMMAQHPRWAETDVSSLTKLTCGGSPAPPPLIEAFEARGLRFSQGYGMTEASPGVTALSPSMTLAKQGSVGLPHFFTHLRIATSDSSPAEAGAIGEIEIAGPNVFGGYRDLPEDNARAFTDDGWFRTGDLGYLDEDGYLFIAGREKDMIISGGENIYPAEVEAHISEMEHVTGVAVVGIPDDQWGEVPCAVVTVAEGGAVDLEQVRSHLDGRVARYKVPKRVVTVEELPRTATGKIRKGELRDSIIAADGNEAS